MSITYNASTNFGAKDNLPVNDPNKVIYGAEFTTEFAAITAAFGNAAPTASPTFTGTATFSGDVSITGSVTLGGSTISSTDIANWNATKATVDAGAPTWDATKATVDAGESNWDEAYSWGDHALAGYGTSSSDTTYTAGAGLSLTGTVFSLASAIGADTVSALQSFALGSRWVVLLDGLDVIFQYQGTTKMKIDTNGNLTVTGNVTAYGSP